MLVGGGAPVPLGRVLPLPLEGRWALPLPLVRGPARVHVRDEHAVIPAVQYGHHEDSSLENKEYWGDILVKIKRFIL